MVLAAGLAAWLFPSLRDAHGIHRLTAGDLEQGKAMFAAMLSGDRDRVAPEMFGLHAKRAPNGWEGVVLAEPKGDCAGRGVYLMREGETAPLAITAPHRGSDRHTGTLAAQLFLETQAQAAAWNSAPRRVSDSCAHAIDLARAPDHLFSAFALGFAKAQPRGLIVQLHGFDGDRRKSEAARTAGMIVSNGTQVPDRRLLDLADCLSLALDPQRVLVYPNETGELGALTNAQGQLLHDAGFGGFVHLEISGPLRARLIGDETLRSRLASCLLEAAR
ncbi:hypothetical protein [Altererythrobacter sp.]|uniref:hypothetical protein n=1 Tax=Altererythrobacter sp. TaxID=1872480 RepID=UPI003CFBF572